MSLVDSEHLKEEKSEHEHPHVSHTETNAKHSKKLDIERFLIIGLVIGATLVGTGIASTIFATQGITAAIALVGSFITFIFTVILVFYWFFRGDEK